MAQASALAVFDLDGTLVDSAGVFADVVNRMLADRGAATRVTVESARRAVALGGRGMLASLLGDGSCDPDADLEEFRLRYVAIPTPPSSLYPGVREGLAELAAAGVRLAICSNKPQRLCEKVMSDLGLVDRFDSIVGSAPGLPGKPDPALFDRALALAGGAPSKFCIVGDELTDRLLARAVGAPFVHAAYGYAATGSDFGDAPRAVAFSSVPGHVVRAFGLDQ